MDKYHLRILEGHKSRATVILPVANTNGDWVKAADADALLARLAEADRLIQDLSWAGSDDWGWYCPSCGNYQDDKKGHSQNCEIDAFLAANT